MKRISHIPFTTALSLSLIVMCSAVGVHEVTGIGGSLAPEPLIEFLSPTPPAGPSITFEDRVVAVGVLSAERDQAQKVERALDALDAPSGPEGLTR